MILPLQQSPNIVLLGVAAGIEILNVTNCLVFANHESLPIDDSEDDDHTAAIVAGVVVPISGKWNQSYLTT
jgi:hypothetical protein